MTVMTALTAVCAATAALAGDGEPADGEALKKVEAFVYYCHDGDTCRVRIADALWTNIRLAGIDAPEMPRGKAATGGQAMATEARDFLNKAIKGKTITLLQTDLDPFNRLVVEVYDKDQLVNRQLIENGLAEVYKGKAKRLDKTPYAAAEATARQAKKGIWGLSQYQSPGDFRRVNR